MKTAQNYFNDSCKNGHLKNVKYFSKKRLVDIHDCEEAPLKWAVENGHLDIVKYLVEDHQADIHASDGIPLKWAAENGHLNIIKYLVKEHHADIHTNSEAALWAAADNGHLDIALYLVDQGAKYRVLQRDEETSYIYDQIVDHMHDKHSSHFYLFLLQKYALPFKRFLSVLCLEKAANMNNKKTKRSVFQVTIDALYKNNKYKKAYKYGVKKIKQKYTKKDLRH